MGRLAREFSRVEDISSRGDGNAVDHRATLSVITAHSPREDVWLRDVLRSILGRASLHERRSIQESGVHAEQ